MPMISGSMSVMPYAAAPGRECGSCGMCCKGYTFPEIGKPAGVWCKYCEPGEGCKIHDVMPALYLDCCGLWMTDAPMPADEVPVGATFVLSVYPTGKFV